MRQIKRELKKFIIHAVRIGRVNGKITQQPLKPVETYERITDNNACKFVKKTMGFDSKELIIIEKVETIIETYTISGENFLKYAKKINERGI